MTLTLVQGHRTREPMLDLPFLFKSFILKCANYAISSLVFRHFSCVSATLCANANRDLAKCQSVSLPISFGLSLLVCFCVYPRAKGVSGFSIKIPFNLPKIVLWSLLRCPGGLPEFLVIFEKKFFFLIECYKRFSDFRAL